MRGILHFLFIIAPRGRDFAPQLLLRALAAIEQSEISVRANTNNNDPGYF